MDYDSEPKPQLSPAQSEIMELIWEHGELSVLQVLEHIGERRAVARNTVRTLLERMEEKGWLVHREAGRAFYYSAAIHRKATIGQKLVELVDTFCGGSAESLVNALINYRGLSESELKAIQKMLADAKALSKKTQRKTKVE